ncbi:MAG: translation initiation factor IF-3 [Lachnospirales bacterium]
MWQRLWCLCIYGGLLSVRFFIADGFKNIWRCPTISELLINEEIREREVRVIDADGTQLGIMPTKEALRIAQEKDLDLINIAPQAKPPVCKILDYGKYRFEQAKREKEAKKKQKVIEIKEVRLSPNIEDHDMNTKAKMAAKFLQNGDKVKVSVRFRGREMTRTEVGRVVLDQFVQSIADVAEVEKPPKMEGRSMVMFLMPKR